MLIEYHIIFSLTMEFILIDSYLLKYTKPRNSLNPFRKKEKFVAIILLKELFSHTCYFTHQKFPLFIFHTLVLY